MKYSLFRLIDIFESFFIYLFCFISNLIFTHLKNTKIEKNYILELFIDSIVRHQLIIHLFLSITILVFHYQFLNRKKIEINCRIIVGDRKINIIIRFILNSLTILALSLLLSFSLNFYLKINITNNFNLVALFILYILISAGQVKTNENSKLFYF